jgi:hypothetical protein
MSDKKKDKPLKLSGKMIEIPIEVPIEETIERGKIAGRLDYLRKEIRAERISMGEIVELQSLTDHIDEGDVELLQWAGVPENK